MDKKTLHKTFSTAFKDSEWLSVLQSVFGARQLLAQPKPILLPSTEKASAAYELGSFTTSDDRIIGLYKIDVKPDVWLERNKVGLRQLLRNVYKYDVDGAIIVFVQEDKWRLSFVSEIKVLNEEGEIVEQATEPKRYTYLLGEGEKVRTPSDRLSKLAGKTLALQDILNAFSVEALNEEFYKIIQAFFYELVGGKVGKGKKVTDYGDGILRLPSQPKENRQIYQEFAVRLIGRTVFCWFLKMKKSDAGESLLPENLLSSEAVKTNAGYYHAILERLFFQTLNTPMDKRVDNLPDGAEQIPFLNGGLFEPDSQDYYKPDRRSGVNQNQFTLRIPDDWFLRFFEELEKYNFTIDENSVTDVEVSVDPEMLGRIFENLLAEIDPDSGETARKATGSFYTPREIVDYMATESLVQYIHNKTNLPQDKLRPIFKMMEQDDPEFSKPEKESILDALDQVKILDPACGSGAFPMGVLQKIVQALQKLDKEAKWWIERQVNYNTHPTARQAEREKLQHNPEYARKIGVIQNSLYGVDIQPIAAEISKLRCFLTLIVDKNINDNLPNRGIEPLPNLEFKFVTADTLIKLPEERDFGGLFNANDDLEQLETIRQEYLQSYGEHKNELKTQFKSIQDKIAKQQIRSRTTDTKSRAWLISTWNPFDHDKADWFDPKWMFGVEKFDVVIGNPPYKILTKNNTEEAVLKNYLSTYKTIKTANSKNIYIPFIENSIESLLNSNGQLCLIVPEGLFTTRSYTDCVELMEKKGSVSMITTFTSFVFENAVTGNLVFLFSKLSNEETKRFQFDKQYNIKYLIEEENIFITKIKTALTTPLNQIASLFKGMVVADRSTVVGEDKSYGNNKFLLGKSIEKWSVIKEFYTEYDSLEIVGGTKKKSKHDTVPRILIRRTGDKLCSSFITEPALTESTLYSCWSTSNNFDNYFLLGLLNSKLLTHFIRHSMITNKQAFPQILMADLKMLPIINTGKKSQEVISSVVKYILQLKKLDDIIPINEYVPNSHIAQLFEDVIDAMVMELYFKEDFEKEGVEFIKYAERDFEPIEGKPEAEQIEIINRAYQKLQQKDNEIRKNLAVMESRLPDIVGVIRGGK